MIVTIIKRYLLEKCLVAVLEITSIPDAMLLLKFQIINTSVIVVVRVNVAEL